MTERWLLGAAVPTLNAASKVVTRILSVHVPVSRNVDSAMTTTAQINRRVSTRASSCHRSVELGKGGGNVHSSVSFACSSCRLKGSSFSLLFGCRTLSASPLFLTSPQPSSNLGFSSDGAAEESGGGMACCLLSVLRVCAGDGSPLTLLAFPVSKCFLPFSFLQSIIFQRLGNKNVWLINESSRVEG